jgi:hypothetical protein
MGGDLRRRLTDRPKGEYEEERDRDGMGEDGRERASDAREKRCGDRIRIGWERIGREGKSY